MERMPHRPGRKGTRTAAETELRPGEKLSALFPALTPPPHAGGGQALDGLALLIVAAEHLAWRRRSRVTARTSMFPLAPRMFIGLTDSRILVWSARYRWRIGRSLGDVSLDRVMAAEAPTAGSVSRTDRRSPLRCRIRLRTAWRPGCQAGHAGARPAVSAAAGGGAIGHGHGSTYAGASIPGHAPGRPCRSPRRRRHAH